MKSYPDVVLNCKDRVLTQFFNPVKVMFILLSDLFTFLNCGDISNFF